MLTDKELKKLAKLIAEELKDEIKKELAADMEQIYDVQEAAAYLKISKDYLYKILPQVPHSQKIKGGKLYFYKSQLDRFILQQ